MSIHTAESKGGSRAGKNQKFFKCFEHLQKCAIMYGQVITEMENLMIIIVLERMRAYFVKFHYTFDENSFDGHNHTFACIYVIIIDIK